MSLEYRVGDVFERLAEIPDGSIDLIVSSPPFLALRSYLPDGHPDKHKEIGQEPTPAEFIDTHLALSAEYARVLAPHGSLCYEIGDTYSGSGGHGGDYAEGGMRDGQPKFKGSASKGNGWPLAKSMCIIPHLFTASLAYGRNLLTGEPSPAGEWRIRNVICWARNNPPVGALGDKFRPATSYITVACKSGKRYFDLDAVRMPYSEKTNTRVAAGVESQERTSKTSPDTNRATLNDKDNDGAGRPPLDWHTDGHPEDGDWLWQLNTQPYSGAHFATYPMALPKRMIEAMCPRKVCTTCGKPSERIVDKHYEGAKSGMPYTPHVWESGIATSGAHTNKAPDEGARVVAVTTGWTDCGCSTDGSHWRTGNVLDPFGGSGTTAEAAQAVGRHAILIDIDERNADLARERVGMFLEINEGAA
jgi:site-specific DNA-methyltransferase (cytosine-N4-specific)